MLIEGINAPLNSETELLIDMDENNYSVLRDYDDAITHAPFKRATSLAQQEQQNSNENFNKAHTRTAQLISEQAEQSIDYKD